MATLTILVAHLVLDEHGIDGFEIAQYNQLQFGGMVSEVSVG